MTVSCLFYRNRFCRNTEKKLHFWDLSDCRSTFFFVCVCSFFSRLVNVFWLGFVWKAGSWYACKPKNTCWRRHWFRGTWPLEGSAKQESGSLGTSALGDRSYLLREEFTETLTCSRPRCWEENWGGSGSGGWCTATPFNKRHFIIFFLATQGGERSPKARESSWDNGTSTQVGNISSYFGIGPVVHPAPATWPPKLHIHSLASVLTSAFKAVNGLTPT